LHNGETIVRPQRVTRPPKGPQAPSASLERSRPRTSADALDAPPSVGLANPFSVVALGPSAAASSHPSQLLPVVEVLRRPFESTQYLSIRYTERLAEAGIENSVGSKGDSYDNALAESVIGLFKTEVIRRQGPWKNLEDVEFA